jgi:hypothetical protein
VGRVLVDEVHPLRTLGDDVGRIELPDHPQEGKDVTMGGHVRWC